jgi:hypothetical protein
LLSEVFFDCFFQKENPEKRFCSSGFVSRLKAPVFSGALLMNSYLLNFCDTCDLSTD